MAKNDKTKNPPAVEAPVVDKKEDKPAEVLNNVHVAGVPDGMTQHDKVLFMTGLQHRKDEMIRVNDNNADKYNALTILEDATIVDIAVTELVVKKNPSALILTANEKNYEAIRLLGAEMGVTLPEFKTLPKPTKQQLEACGLTDDTGKVVLKLEDKNVSKETKEKKKKEQKILEESKNKDYVKDHTKIETDEQLKEALGFQLLNPAISNPVEKLVTTAQFYRAYLEAHAEKADDPQAELAKIHELTIADLLQDIITMVPPTFVASGFGALLGRIAHDANSVVPAFCRLKNCVVDRKTGRQKFSDEEIAALTRILVAWYVSAKSAEMASSIKAKEENIKVLKKDEKANEKAIESEEKKIAGLKASIEHFTKMLSLVTDPTFETVDDLIAAYNNNENPNHISAKEIVKTIIESYYRDVEITELEFDSMLLNAQQRAGMILNLFSSSIAKRDEYNESNLIVFETKKEDKKEGEGEKKEEEGSKNA